MIRSSKMHHQVHDALLTHTKGLKNYSSIRPLFLDWSSMKGGKNENCVHIISDTHAI